MDAPQSMVEASRELEDDLEGPWEGEKVRGAASRRNTLLFGEGTSRNTCPAWQNESFFNQCSTPAEISFTSPLAVA